MKGHCKIAHIYQPEHSIPGKTNQPSVLAFVGAEKLNKQYSICKVDSIDVNR
jgi:hypothetical protein